MADSEEGIQHFTPEIVEKYEESDYALAKMLVELQTCYKCKRYTIKRPHENADPFPTYVDLNFEAQIAAAGWVEFGAQYGDEAICKECIEAGKVIFQCALCKTVKTTDMIFFSVGTAPPEHLCKDCYKSVTAETWCKKIAELDREHEYDPE